MKNISYFAIITFLAAILSVNIVFADGGYFPHPDYWVTPGQQRAVIFYEDNTETMILTSSFRGNAKDLVWIIPTPTKPEVTKADEKVFTNIAKLTRVQYRGGLSYGMVKSAALAEDVAPGVIVLESKQVDYYDVNILLATNTQDLVKWFNENNYVYPESYSYVLKSYIERGWYFTTIKVSPEATGATEVMQDLKEGHPTPVKMVFLSNDIVFPLKISSVEFPKSTGGKYGFAKDELIGATRKDSSSYTWTKKTNFSGGLNWCRIYYDNSETCIGDDFLDKQLGGVNYNNPNDYRYNYNYVPINLYLIASEKYEADDFYTQYGNWVKKDDIEKLGNDDSGKSFFKPKKNKYFLTYFSANLQKSQMDSDVIFRKATDNKKVNAGPEPWVIFVQGLILGIIVSVVWVFLPPFGIFFIAGILILFLSSSKAARVFGWILTAIPLALTILFGGVLFLIAAINNTLSNYIVLSLIITDVLIIILILIFMRMAAIFGGKK
jgi:hypothetical protein